MSARLRVGVIGLGRRWRRYRPALLGLREQFEVRGVCDPVARRAEREAGRLHCPAAAGPVDLLERDEVEVVLLLEAPWYGLWPLERACACGKPVFCAASLAADDAHADALHRQVESARLPVLMALPAAVAPAAARLRTLFDGPLGPPRLLRGDRVLPGAPAPLPLSALLPLLHTAALLLDDAPRGVRTTVSESASFVSLLLDFPGGRTAQLNLWSGPSVGPASRLEAVTAAGTATAELPCRLRWSDADGRHTQVLRPQSVERALLERFAAAVRGGQPPRPGFEDAYQALTWLRAARRSQAEGRAVDLAEPAENAPGA